MLSDASLTPIVRMSVLTVRAFLLFSQYVFTTYPFSRAELAARTLDFRRFHKVLRLSQRVAALQHARVNDHRYQE
jgi:hypothetical protein